MMKTNKITLMVMGLALVLVSLIASCKKNDNNAVVGKGFIAQTEQGGGNSRTHGVPSSDGIAVQWTSGDQILVANQDGNGDQLTYTLKGGANSTEGTFASVNETSDFLEPAYVAIYPATNVAGTANTISGTTAIFNLPATQTYLENSFAEKAMPMVAYSSDQSLHFKNVLGGLCFPIVGNGMRVTKVEVISTADEALWGTCTTTISSSNGDPSSEVAYSDAAQKTITLDCSANGGLLLSGTATDFYIMVPAGTLESGFTVRAYNGNEMIYEKSTTNAPGAGFIPRSVVRKVDGNLEIAIFVRTISPTYISTNSAKGIGVASHVFKENGILYAKGSYYNGMTDAQIKEVLIVDGSNVQKATTTPATNFDIDLTGLDENTVYYVRAYAITDGDAIIYGDDIFPFATRRDYSVAPYYGAMPYTFAVSPTKQVYFSMGNLQYTGSGSNTWRFAVPQFRCLGGGAGWSYSQARAYPGLERDLFPWGTSNRNHGANWYEPWHFMEGNTDISILNETATNYWAYGDGTKDLGDETGEADWGYNDISNDGLTGEGLWRTLTGGVDGEWGYLFDHNTWSMTKLNVEGAWNNSTWQCVSNVCIMFFPTGFQWPLLVNKNLSYNNTNLGDNVLTEAEWSLIEQNGVVVLPSAGRRGEYSQRPTESAVFATGTLGHYWSSTHGTDVGVGMNRWNAFNVEFYDGTVDPAKYGTNNMGNTRRHGRAVRLVRDAN